LQKYYFYNNNELKFDVSDINSLNFKIKMILIILIYLVHLLMTWNDVFNDFIFRVEKFLIIY